MDKRQEPTDHLKTELGHTSHRPVWALYLSLVTRTAHQVGAAVFLACFLLDEMVGVPGVYFTLAVGSGLLLVIVEGARHRQMFREVSGLMTLAKCLLLGVAFHGLVPSTPGILAAFAFASLGAHAPKNYRHRLIW